MQDNPYRAPEESIRVEGGGSTLDRVRASLRAPALALVVLACLAIIGDLAVLNDIRVSVQHGGPGPVGGGELRRDPASALISAVINGGLFFIHATVLVGAIAMRRVRSYRLARAAALIAVVPLCSPGMVLGIPFGFWAYRVLRREGVRAVFDGADRE